MINSCPVCLAQDVTLDPRRSKSPNAPMVICPRCGDYLISTNAAITFGSQTTCSETGEPRLGTSGSRLRSNASAWVRENASGNADLMLGLQHLNQLARLKEPKFPQKAMKLLLALQRESPHAGARCRVYSPKWEAEAWALNDEELHAILIYLQETDRVRVVDSSGGDWVHISSGGWEFLEERAHPNPSSTQAFVAMSFHEEKRHIFDEALVPAIRQAGYDEVRLDNQEFLGRIDDQMISQIKQSRFLVAEYTQQIQGVYYEAGLAEGFGIPVISCCKKDQVDGLHFDVSHINCFLWETTEELQERLRYRIERTLGRGPNYGQSEGDL